MSDVRLVVREAGQDWSGRIHGSDADRAIAALSADPVTLPELEVAVTRFTEPTTQRRLFGHLTRGLRDEPYDAGLVVIDLVARLVVIDSTYSSPGPVGSVRTRDDQGETDIPVTYHLADNWLFLHDGNAWRAVAEARRGERTGCSLLDARAVLYGRPMLEFIARETLATFQRDTITDADDADRFYDAFKNIHAAWLLTPRDDLQSACPREVMLERRDHLMRDLQDRSQQWSRQGECPPGLEESSFAFRHGGFGTHELVMYYGLIRELLWSSWDRLKGLSEELHLSDRPKSFTAGDFLTTEVPRLERVRDEWLDTPDPEYHMRTPRSIIHRERRRLPEGVSGEEAIIDPDCPCCQMMCDMPGPVFWHLDGSEMDHDFAFDLYHQTREEWEEEQREWEESSRRFAAEQEERQRLGLTDCSSDEL